MSFKSAIPATPLDPFRKPALGIVGVHHSIIAPGNGVPRSWKQKMRDEETQQRREQMAQQQRAAGIDPATAQPESLDDECADHASMKPGNYRPGCPICESDTGCSIDVTAKGVVGFCHACGARGSAGAPRAATAGDAAAPEPEVVVDTAKAARAEAAWEKYKARWDAADPAGAHWYLDRKGIALLGGARVYRTPDNPFAPGDPQMDLLMVPMYDAEGTLRNFQSIGRFLNHDGETQEGKRFVGGAPVQGMHLVIGDPTSTYKVIAEGYADAVSIHAATGATVVVAFGTGNLLRVAQTLRAAGLDDEIVLAADDDRRANGANPGLEAATRAAEAVGGYLAVPVWPASTPRGPKDKDFNDLARSAGADAVVQCLKAAQKMDTVDPEDAFPTRAAAREYLLTRYAYIAEIDAFWDRKLGKAVKAATVINAMAHRMPMGGGEKPRPINPAHLILGDAAFKFDRLAMHPGQAGTYRDGGALVLNTYRAPQKLDPVAGDVSLFLDHMEYLFNGDPAEAGIFLDWLAYLLQRPGEKITWAPLHIARNEGLGRGWVAALLRRLLGAWNVYEPNARMLTKDFNAWQARTQLCVVPEMFLGGGFFEREPLWLAVKTIITDEYLPIEFKGIDIGEGIPNRMNCLLFSNSIEAVPVTLYDRRLWITVATAKPRDRDYYKHLYAALARPAFVRAVLYHLLHRDLAAFTAHTPPPPNDAKRAMAAANASPLEQAVMRMWDERDTPFDHPFVRSGAIQDRLRTSSGGGMNLTNAKLSSIESILEAHGATKLRGGAKVRLEDKPAQGSYWKLTDADADGKAYDDMKEGELRDAFKGAKARKM